METRPVPGVNRSANPVRAAQPGRAPDEARPARRTVIEVGTGVVRCDLGAGFAGEGLAVRRARVTPRPGPSWYAEGRRLSMGRLLFRMSVGAYLIATAC